MSYLWLCGALCARRPAILQPVADSILVCNRLLLLRHTGKPPWTLPLRSHHTHSGQEPRTGQEPATMAGADSGAGSASHALQYQ